MDALLSPLAVGLTDGVLGIAFAAIAGLFAAYTLEVRDRRSADAARLQRLDDRDERILNALSTGIQGIAASMTVMTDSSRDYRAREEATLADIIRRLERLSEQARTTRGTE